eukprot:scaffold170191_cov54-Attheya_sp.AAC.5
MQMPMALRSCRKPSYGMPSSAATGNPFHSMRLNLRTNRHTASDPSSVCRTARNFLSLSELGGCFRTTAKQGVGCCEMIADIIPFLARWVWVAVAGLQVFGLRSIASSFYLYWYVPTGNKRYES